MKTGVGFGDRLGVWFTVLLYCTWCTVYLSADAEDQDEPREELEGG